MCPYDSNRRSDNTNQEKVEVLIGGDKDRVDKFVEFVKNNFPEDADVDKPIGDAENYEGDIRTTESFSRCLSVHQLTKFAIIGTKIVVGQENLRKDTNDNFAKMVICQENLRKDTNENFSRMDENFKHMDEKYHIISERMFALIDAIEKRQQSFEMHVEKIDKNIETLLEILAKKEK